MGNRVRPAVLIIIVKLVIIGADLTCHLRNDDALSLAVKASHTCEDFSWKTNNGTVLAHDQDPNTAVVLRMSHGQGQYNITLRTCHSNVTFACVKETVSCGNVCPAHIHNPDRPSREHAAVIGSVLLFIVVLFTIIIRTSWKRFTRNERSQAEPDSSV